MRQVLLGGFRMIRCDPPDCQRPEGHAGDCRPTYKVIDECGQWMPNAQEPCARGKGHAWGHRSRYALDNDRQVYWRKLGQA